MADFSKGREWLLEEVGNAIEFREWKAREHPEDPRNERSVANLKDLHRHLEMVGEDYPLIVQANRLIEKEEQDDSDIGVIVSEEVLSGPEDNTGVFAKFGFHQKEDPEQWCESLAEELKTFLDEEEAQGADDE